MLRETVGGYAAFVDPLATAAEIAAVMDATWGRPGDPAAREALLARYAWPAVVTRLRESLLGVLG